MARDIQTIDDALSQVLHEIDDAVSEPAQKIGLSLAIEVGAPIRESLSGSLFSARWFLMVGKYSRDLDEYADDQWHIMYCACSDDGEKLLYCWPIGDANVWFKVAFLKKIELLISDYVCAAERRAGELDALKPKLRILESALSSVGTI